MRKLLVIAGVLAIACAKETQEEFTSIHFGMKGVEEYAITKAPSDEARALISANIPTSIDLTLTRTKTGKKYYVSLGESVTLPVGEYTVKGSVKPQSLTAFPRSGMAVAETAFLSVNEPVTIESGVSAYTLTPIFDCFAVVGLDDVDSFTWRHGSASGSSTEGHKVYFFTWDNNYELSIVAKPTDYDSKDDAGFVFGGTGVNATNGKFYIVHPESVTTEEGGFSFGSASWTEGQL